MHITLICADEDTWALGMRSLSMALKEAGHTTTKIFAAMPAEALGEKGLESIRSLTRGSDLIGVSSMSRGSGKAKAIIRALKTLNRPIVWGGVHPTIFPEDCLEEVGLICRGEGEEFMVELAHRLMSGQNIRTIPNGGYRRDGKVVLNELRPLDPDLDRYADVDFSFDDEFVIARDGTALQNGSMKNAATVYFRGSRGCYGECHYCSNEQLKAIYRNRGRYVRRLSVDAFVDSAAALLEKFPRVKHFYFTDEDFFARPVEELKRFARLYPERVGIPFECMATPRQVTEEKMDLMVKAGMWRIDLGVESGCDAIKKDVFNRPVPNETVLRAAGIINRHPHIVAYYFFIIGNPYEDRQALLDTIRLLRKLPSPFYLRTYNLVFIPGTTLFKRAINDRIINGLKDSGFELDFLGGLTYREHRWKRKNLYLNALVFLMAGKATRWRLGLVPRAVMPLLLHPHVIDLHDRHQVTSKAYISLGRRLLSARHAVSGLIKIMFKDQTLAYRLTGLKWK